MVTKIFCDGGDPEETRELLGLLGFLDGQTTNPSLLSKNPEAKKRMEKGEKFSRTELLYFYKSVVQRVSKMIPEGSVSIEVYADKNTSADDMLTEARDFFTWIPNAHIKFPTTREGLKAAEQAVQEGIRVNMTLCFSQEQAAAVYSATKGAVRGQVFVSPFVGRLDDRGQNGMDLVKNIIEMYKKGDGHVEVLAASVRTMEHFHYALFLKSGIITAPFSVIREWGIGGMLLPNDGFSYHAKDLEPIAYKKMDLETPWRDFDVRHELTDAGMQKFSDDWNNLLAPDRLK